MLALGSTSMQKNDSFLQPLSVFLVFFCFQCFMFYVLRIFPCSDRDMPAGTSTPVHLNGVQDEINQSSCKHEAIYSALIHFPKTIWP